MLSSALSGAPSSTPQSFHLHPQQTPGKPSPTCSKQALTHFSGFRISSSAHLSVTPHWCLGLDPLSAGRAVCMLQEKLTQLLAHKLSSFPQCFPVCCSCDHLMGYAGSRESRHIRNSGLSSPRAGWVCAMGAVSHIPAEHCLRAELKESFQWKPTLVCQEVTRNLTIGLPYFPGALLGTPGVSLAVFPSLRSHKGWDVPGRCQLAESGDGGGSAPGDTSCLAGSPDFASFGR